METKGCTRCGISQPLDDAHFGKRKTKTGQGWRWDSWCKTCCAANTRRIQRVDPERKRQADREWRERNSEECKARARERYRRLTLSQRDCQREYARNHNNRLKREALEHYGGIFCRCCGESELLMLSLDHIANDGAKHRKSLTGSTRLMPQVSYIWAKKNNWPPIFQVMCMNCNWARHWSNGICPHEIACQNIGNARSNQAA